MTQIFPQLNFSVVLSHVDAQIPLPAHAFWLFNGGGLASPQQSGNLCRLVLLDLDPTNARAACMIGYGLEPFIPPDALDRIALAAIPGLQAVDVSSAILAALESARTELAAVSQAISQSNGLANKEQTMMAGNDEAEYAY